MLSKLSSLVCDRRPKQSNPTHMSQLGGYLGGCQLPCRSRLSSGRWLHLRQLSQVACKQQSVAQSATHTAKLHERGSLPSFLGQLLHREVHACLGTEESPSPLPGYVCTFIRTRNHPMTLRIAKSVMHAHRVDKPTASLAVSQHTGRSTWRRWPQESSETCRSRLPALPPHPLAHDHTFSMMNHVCCCFDVIKALVTLPACRWSELSGK
jgi:hypothetical protein